MANESDDKKIIVDEDWKSQVETERESLRQQEEATPEGASETAGAGSQRTEPIPPASFETLIISLASQAMSCLGQMADDQGRPMVDLEVGKHLIDTIELLQTKTEGNLTSAEGSMLENTLHHLRMLYVALQNAGQANAGPSIATE